MRRRSDHTILTLLGSAAGLAALALCWQLLQPTTPAQMTPLGDVSAQYPSLPQQQTLSFRPPASQAIHPATVQPYDARAALLTALNCERAARGLPGLVLDPELSTAAQQAWERLREDPGFGLEDLPDSYGLRGLLTLDPASEASGCSVGGYDFGQLPELDAIDSVGFAYFAPQTEGGWDGASVLVLGR